VCEPFRVRDRLGIRAPDRRASLSAMATACFRLRTFRPLDDRKLPRLYSRITLPTFFWPVRRVMALSFHRKSEPREHEGCEDCATWRTHGGPSRENSAGLDRSSRQPWRPADAAERSGRLTAEILTR